MPEEEISQPEIVGVVWFERGHQFEVTDVHGAVNRRQGSLQVATELAERSGLQTVPTLSGMVRWVRDPESTEKATKA
jgi:hypothetical protein